MPITKGSYVRVAPDSTGKKVRNLEMITVDPTTGEEHMVDCQVVVLMTPDGRLVSPDTTMRDTLLEQMADRLAELTDLVRELVTYDTRHGNVKKGDRHFSTMNRRHK